jgi:hypothetical protein
MDRQSCAPADPRAGRSGDPVFIAPILFVFYGEPMREAWQRADRPRFADRDQALEAAGLRE